MKQRRTRRKTYNWEAEISKGNTDKFYHSTDFDIAREKVQIQKQNIKNYEHVMETTISSYRIAKENL